MIEGAKRGGRGKKKLCGKLLQSLEEGSARAVTAKAARMSHETYKKAKTVVAAAKEDPVFQPLVEQMDRTGKVASAWKRLPEDLRQPAAPGCGGGVAIRRRT